MTACSSVTTEQYVMIGVSSDMVDSEDHLPLPLEQLPSSWMM